MCTYTGMLLHTCEHTQKKWCRCFWTDLKSEALVTCHLSKPTSSHSTYHSAYSMICRRYVCVQILFQREGWAKNLGRKLVQTILSLGHGIWEGITYIKTSQTLIAVASLRNLLGPGYITTVVCHLSFHIFFPLFSHLKGLYKVFCIFCTYFNTFTPKQSFSLLRC